MSEHFSEPKSLGGRLKVELDLSNYATKADLKNVICVDTSKFARKIGLANLKSIGDKLDIDKLKNIPTNLGNLKSKLDKLNVDKLVLVSFDLSKLIDAVKSDVVKKDVYNAKIKNIEDEISDITNVATKTTLNAKINEDEVKIPNIINLATNASLNAKIDEVKGKIPNITNSATTSALTVIENEIPSVRTLVKKLTITQKLLIIITINILNIRQNLIRLQPTFLI